MARPILDADLAGNQADRPVGQQPFIAIGAGGVFICSPVLRQVAKPGLFNMTVGNVNDPIHDGSGVIGLLQVNQDFRFDGRKGLPGPDFSMSGPCGYAEFSGQRGLRQRVVLGELDERLGRKAVVDSLHHGLRGRFRQGISNKTVVLLC
jgi:hypothetical protein